MLKRLWQDEHVTIFQGKRMREARAALHLTQQQVADAAKTSRETVNRAENGQHVPEAEALARIARVLDVPLGSLFSDDSTAVSA